jgi:hypothetical protein
MLPDSDSSGGRFYDRQLLAYTPQRILMPSSWVRGHKNFVLASLAGYTDVSELLSVPQRTSKQLLQICRGTQEEEEVAGYTDTASVLRFRLPLKPQNREKVEGGSVTLNLCWKVTWDFGWKLDKGKLILPFTTSVQNPDMERLLIINSRYCVRKLGQIVSIELEGIHAHWGRLVGEGQCWRMANTSPRKCQNSLILYIKFSFSRSFASLKGLLIIM